MVQLRAVRLTYEARRFCFFRRRTVLDAVDPYAITLRPRPGVRLVVYTPYYFELAGPRELARTRWRWGRVVGVSLVWSTGVVQPLALSPSPFPVVLVLIDDARHGRLLWDRDPGVLAIELYGSAFAALEAAQEYLNA